MGKTIKINAFTGMNNVKKAEGLFVGKGGVVEPRIILNSDVTGRGRVIKRDGYTKVISMSDPHSLWGNNKYMLCVDGGYLYYIDNETAATPVCAVTDPDNARMYYAEVGQKVYLSSKWWNGVFDPAALSVSSWGITLPAGPMLSAGAGNLPEGTYHVCLTTELGGEISGNGPISQITLAAEGGISISNRGADDIVWCTDPNGDTFYRIGKVDAVVSIPTVEPLPSLFCYPPPFLNFLTHAFGRMWGMVGSRLYYSESFKWSWWKLGQCFFDFASEGALLAKTKTGLFVGCKDRTYSLLGTEPEKMEQTDVGAGAIPGTLAYCNNIIELGDTISPPEKKHAAVPVWMSEEGIVAGNPAGRLFSLSQGKIKFAPGKQGASLYRQKNGDVQFLTSFCGGAAEDSMGISDEATIEIFRNGKVIPE